MSESAGIETHIVALLAAYGVPTDEMDEAIIALIWQQFGPGLEELLGADLSAVDVERPCDPSMAPA
jgi:hypothetical protein